jgi:two-component system response regulator RegX3
MNRKAKILVVEDEQAIRTGLVDVLVFHGFEADFAETGDDALQKAMSGRYDLVLLDVMLPGINGFDICEQVRQVHPDQPIIMLTARSTDEDVIQGLSLGADDYVSKPFSVAQLVLRVQAVLRRSGSSGNERQHIRLSSNVCIDCLNLSGKREDEELYFTRREIELLQYLGNHSGRPVSRNELLEHVWGYAGNPDLETRTVDIHIAKLRRKIEIDPAHPQFLITVRGSGYRLKVDDEAQ